MKPAVEADDSSDPSCFSCTSADDNDDCDDVFFNRQASTQKSSVGFESVLTKLLELKVLNVLILLDVLLIVSEEDEHDGRQSDREHCGTTETSVPVTLT